MKRYTSFLRAAAAAASLWWCTSPAWALLPIQHWTSPQGAQVWLVESPTIPMVDVQIDFDAGSRRDPVDKAGLSDAFAAITSRGILADGDAPGLDENALGEAWADLGAGMQVSADADVLHYALRSLTEPALLQKAATLASRILAQPSWPADVWQRDRERWSASLKEAQTRPATVAGDAFAQAVYRDHPYGYRTTPASLAAIDVADFQAFHGRYIVPCRARISMVGAVDKARAQALVDTLLSRLPKADAAACAPLPVVSSITALPAAVELKIPFESAQTHVLIGQPGFIRRDPDFLALLVGNHILGGGGFVSRLTNEVREKRGLSYSVYSYFAPGQHEGAFTVGLQTRPDQAQQAVDVARATVKKFVEQGPTEAELRAAKDNLVGGFALRIDSNRELLANVANIAHNGLPLDYLEHWTDRVDALTVADIRAAMFRKLQPDRMVTVTVGPQQP